MRLDKKKILRDIDGNEVFFVNDGSIIKSIKELPLAFQSMSTETFAFHNTRNDFSNWVKDICGDTKLANDLQRIKTQITSEKKVAARVEMLLK